MAISWTINSTRQKPSIWKTKMPSLAMTSEILSQPVLDDFKELEEAGVTHPDMEKIKALLTTETEAR
jgi:hypothetical protein